MNNIYIAFINFSLSLSSLTLTHSHTHKEQHKTFVPLFNKFFVFNIM